MSSAVLAVVLAGWATAAGPACAAPTGGPHRSRVERGLLLGGPERLRQHAGRRAAHFFQYGRRANSAPRRSAGPVDGKGAPQPGDHRPAGLHHLPLPARVTGRRGRQHGRLHDPEDPPVGGDRGGAQPRHLRSPSRSRAPSRAPADGNRQVALQFTPFPYTAAFSQSGNALVTSLTGGFVFPGLGAAREHKASGLHRRPGPCDQPARHRAGGGAGDDPRPQHPPARLRTPVRDRRTRRGRRPDRLPARDPRSPPEERRRHRRQEQSATKSVFSRVVKVKKGLYQALVKVSDGAHVSGHKPPRSGPLIR